MARRPSLTISDAELQDAETYRLGEISRLQARDSLSERDAKGLDRLRQATAKDLVTWKKRREREQVLRDHREECRQRKETWTRTVDRRGRRYANCRFGNFETTDPRQVVVVRELRAWCDDLPERVQAGEGLLLFGTVGCGKDHLLAAVVRQAVLRFGIPVHWVTGAKLCEAWRGDRPDPLEHMYLVYGSRPSVLAISDPAPGGPLTPFLLEKMTGVIDRHYSEGSSLWVTINGANRESLEQAIGSPIVDRLVHGATVVACDWPSYRRPLGR